MIFLTDGLPTVGVTGLDPIRTAIQQANRRKARVFVFGVGYDVNVPFLDRLSTDNRGDAEYVRPGDNLETRMASFYEKQAQPLLTDLKLAVDGVDAVDVIPAELPDLFANVTFPGATGLGFEPLDPVGIRTNLSFRLPLDGSIALDVERRRLTLRAAQSIGEKVRGLFGR